MAFDEIGKRMKENYENRAKTYLTRRTPVIIRLDGKAFHTFTRGFNRPFDEVLSNAMNRTMQYLCENIQGCVLGYTQSDEITLVLIDYMNLNSDGWFDYNVQKMCSISASMATMAFNRYFEDEVSSWRASNWIDTTEYSEQLDKAYIVAQTRGAMFDSRVFNIPKEEVCNCLIWRQLDATRNSIQMLGQANFSHKELQNKSCNTIQDMLMAEKGINWNDTPTRFKRGVCCIKEKVYPKPAPGCEDCPVCVDDIKTRWTLDTEIPIFTQDRNYIERLILV